jgi:hypothetical protein
MVAVNRGSTSQLTVIKEATPGVTPATPTMLQMPVVSFTPKATKATIRSNQIRGHPFVDKLLAGRLTHDFGLEVELAGAVHDALLETFFGGVITAKALAAADALKSLTMEETVKTSDYNQWVYSVLSSLSITASAGDTTPVKMTFNGQMKSATLDAASTLATTVTPAASIDPFTFIGAGVTVSGTTTPASSGTISFDRQVDPLLLLGSELPREFVPGEMTATGSITVPYDDTGAASGATISSIVTGFTDAPLVFTFGNVGGTSFRKFTFPKTKFTSLGRSLSDRGQRMQEVNWEAYFDTSTSTICTMTTE